jgi:proteasome lid subunit RPN8/RPN11
MKNYSSKPSHYEVDLDELREVRREMKAHGIRVVGTFHSHPVSYARPGPGDCRSAPLNSLMLVYDVVARSGALWRIVRNGKRKMAKEVDLFAMPKHWEGANQKMHSICTYRAKL